MRVLLLFYIYTYILTLCLFCLMFCRFAKLTMTGSMPFSIASCVKDISLRTRRVVAKPRVCNGCDGRAGDACPSLFEPELIPCALA